ncbi:14075_t:CDS:2 [Rhizophagus irregularis]|nr:14075_t:CDS:2 [Rhizophagus irregularis]
MGGVLKKPTDNDNTDNNTDNIDNSISSPTIQLISTEHIDAVLEWRHRTFWDCIEYIREEFNAAEEYRINSTSAPNSPSMFHPLAIYTSRLLSFSNLKVW